VILLAAGLASAGDSPDEKQGRTRKIQPAHRLRKPVKTRAWNRRDTRTSYLRTANPAGEQPCKWYRMRTDACQSWQLQL